MKKLFWITFFTCLLFLFNRNEIKSEDYNYLLENKNDKSIVKINVNINSLDLVKLLDSDNIYLLSVTPLDKQVKYITPNGYNIESQVESLNNKMFDIYYEKGKEEEGIYYKINGFNISSIKVFGNNEDIYNLTNNL